MSSNLSGTRVQMFQLHITKAVFTGLLANRGSSGCAKQLGAVQEGFASLYSTSSFLMFTTTPSTYSLRSCEFIGEFGDSLIPPTAVGGSFSPAYSSTIGNSQIPPTGVGGLFKSSLSLEHCTTACCRLSVKSGPPLEHLRR